jgi:hypothetical protein
LKIRLENANNELDKVSTGRSEAERSVYSLFTILGFHSFLRE